MGSALDEVPLLEDGDDPRHGRRLHLLVVGELARGHRLVAVECREGGKLDVGQHHLGAAESEALHPETPCQPADRDPHRGRQAGVGCCYCLRHLLSRPCEGTWHKPVKGRPQEIATGGYPRARYDYW
jgi:hypothetical protein